MPFDGNEKDHLPANRGRKVEIFGLEVYPVEMIDKVIKQLPSEDRWCKGALHTVDGRHCILGAMQSAGMVGAIPYISILKGPVLQAIHEVTGRRYAEVETFNDRKSTTYETVMDVLYRARQDFINGTNRIGAYYKPIGPFRRIFGFN